MLIRRENAPARSPAACTRSATPSPVQRLQAFLDGCGHPFAYRSSHPRNGKKVQRLLDRAPIVHRDEDSISALAGDLDRLACDRRLVEQLVEIRPRLTGCDGFHG